MLGRRARVAGGQPSEAYVTKAAHAAAPNASRGPQAPSGPRYATRRDFVCGEDVTIGEWTIVTEDLPRYA
jgi:hypothetical protein